ncbi:lysophospholipase D GDPD1-like [Heterodontus francisci]|uniref:lysophospholipase D GDPD1-like n=1 Tax=Heterodontus francisci TaxID=7792 RepID=UPI00355B08F5
MDQLCLPLLSITAGYILTSFYLLRNPGVIHRKKRLAFQCRHISHRGGAGERIENTMEAFQHALACHTEMLELDCHMTRDGQVVVSHDQNLLRQTGTDVNIADRDYADLPPYKEKLEVWFYPGHYSSGSDRKIPLLEDVFQTFPHLPINVEIKVDSRELIRKVSDLVKKYHREEITVWATKSKQKMQSCHKENPYMPMSFTSRRIIWTLLLFYAGFLPFVPLPESCFECFMPSIINRYYFPEMPILRNKHVARLLDWLLMRKSLIRHLTDRGIQVYFWVLNEESDYRQALDYGVTGVMTDYPSKLRKFLDEMPPVRGS